MSNHAVRGFCNSEEIDTPFQMEWTGDFREVNLDITNVGYGEKRNQRIQLHFDDRDEFDYFINSLIEAYNEVQRMIGGECDE